MATVLDKAADAAPTADDIVYVINNPLGVPGDRKVTLANLAGSIAFSGLYAPQASPTFTGVANSPTYGVSGLTGGSWSSLDGRWVGVTADVAPTVAESPAGGFELGDWVVSRTGRFWTCITAGDPGVWAESVDSLDQLDDNAPGRTFLDTSTPGLIKIAVDLATGVTNGDKLTGGNGPADNLYLMSTSDAEQGSIELLDSNVTYTDVTPPATFGMLARTLIMDTVAAPAFPSFISNTTTYRNDRAGVTQGNPVVMFNMQPTYKNDNGVAADLSSSSSGAGMTCFWDRSTTQADGAAVESGIHISYRASAAFSILNAGTLTGQLQSFRSAPTVGAGVTLSNLSHVFFVDTVNAGTITEQVGIEIPAFANATANIGIRNNSLLRQVGRTTFGADSAATWFMHLRGGNVGQNAIGIDKTTTNTTIPALNAGATLTVWENGAGEAYLVLKWNRGGTVDHKYLRLDDSSTTWVYGTAMP